jgi:type I restriction enzyme S subunit
MDSPRYPLPSSWEYASLDSLYLILGGGTPSTLNENYWNGDIPWVTSADIDGVNKLNIRRHISKKGIKESATNKVPPKSLLVATRVGLGKIAICESEICFSQDIQALVQNPDLIIPEYAVHFLSFELQFLKHQSQGTTISGLTKKMLKDLGFPLPPIDEQHRIVAKIEELFSELDKGVESLKTALEKLKLYRQSLLKHAFEGKLTEQWRKENPDKLESPDELLVRIQREREERYRYRLKEWKTAKKEWETNGKTTEIPKKPVDFTKIQPKRPKFDGFQGTLFQIPNDWNWVNFEILTEFVTSGSRNWAKFYSENGALFIRAQDLKMDFLDLSEPAFVTLPEKAEGKRTKVSFSDLLVTITGANVTKTGLVEKEIGEAYVSQHVALCRPINPEIAKFLFFYLINEFGGRKQLSTFAYGAGKPGLNLANIKFLAIPMASIEECALISQRIEESLKRLDDLEFILEEKIESSNILRQSILKKAFSGQLVLQDPTDEPAAVLLERIKAEKEAQAQKAKAARAKAAKPKTRKTPRKKKASA